MISSWTQRGEELWAAVRHDRDVAVMSETARDKCRRDVAASGLTPVAVTHLTRDALATIDLANLAAVKALLKRFFSAERWTLADRRHARSVRARHGAVRCQPPGETGCDAIGRPSNEERAAQGCPRGSDKTGERSVEAIESAIRTMSGTCGCCDNRSGAWAYASGIRC
jgi:hypothetical protein